LACEIRLLGSCEAGHVLFAIFNTVYQCPMGNASQCPSASFPSTLYPYLVNAKANVFAL